MKAYDVYDSARDDNCSTIVFAENPTQAKLIAQSIMTKTSVVCKFAVFKIR